MTDAQREEQIQLAREIGEELTEAFIAYVTGEVAFDDLTFGVYDALSDLHVIASGDYELEDEASEASASDVVDTTFPGDDEDIVTAEQPRDIPSS
ncbi:MAG TPA: hypothetical protein VFQ54_02055 [Thermomicrobiales bacterium]|nr:hypothetical protein [Thermomicrobiales bacterium]